MILKPRMILQPKPGDSETKTDDSETKNDSETKKNDSETKDTWKPKMARLSNHRVVCISFRWKHRTYSTSMFLPIRMAWQRLITRMLTSRIRASHVTEVEKGGITYKDL